MASANFGEMDVSLQKKLRNFAEPWIPPRIAWLVSHLRHGRSGLGPNLADWEAAKANSSSYDSKIILDRIREATRLADQAGNTTGNIERDGVVLSGQEPRLPLMSCLLRCAFRTGGNLTVLDFGGALGSTYWQCREFLSVLETLRWHVVEQESFVACGESEFETANLRFFRTIETAAAAGRPDVIIFSGVLQYLDDPYDTLTRAMQATPSAIIIDRTPVSDLRGDTFTVQHVPRAIYAKTLPFRIFGKTQFADCLEPLYRRTVEFTALDPDMATGSVLARHRGYLFEKTG
jgi:putative methyltransferase (TIGR04325 family)